MINGESQTSGVLLLVPLNSRELVVETRARLAFAGVSCVTFYDLPDLNSGSSYYNQCAKQVARTSNLGVILSSGCRDEILEAVIESTRLLHIKSRL
jgi:hypothetical protein